MSIPARYPAWLRQAYEQCRRAAPGAMQSEIVSIDDAVSRVAAADVIAPDNVPAIALAASEGYALCASDTAAATQRTPVELDASLGWRMLTSPPGGSVDRAINARCTVDIPAYFPLPNNADAIAPKSGHPLASQGARSVLRLKAPIARGDHVIAPGSEYRKGDVLLAKGERVNAERQIALIAAGVREIAVTKRPRIGVVIVGYDHTPPHAARAPWQRPDTSGPYIRATLQRWGYDVPPAEYLDPPDSVPPSVDSQQHAYAFKVKLAELAQRYDLIVGAGLPVVHPFQSRGLNARPMYPNEQWVVDIRQTPAGRFNFGRSEDRSPPTKWVVPITRPDGTPCGTHHLVSYDQAVLVNLPGHTSSVAALMHAIVPHMLDALEYVATPGPHWEAASITHDVETDVAFNGMRWGTLHRTERGESRVSLLPFQGDGPLRGVAEADVLVAIPAGETVLPAGTPVLFLRLDRTRAPADAPANSADVRTQPPQAATAAAASASVADSTVIDVPQAWTRIERLIATDPARLPGGLNGPADERAIAALHAALGSTLPDGLLESLRLHDGQTDPDAIFADSDALLGAQEIVAQWSIWQKLVAGGDFDDMTSEPDAGIRDDWYNLKWIPFTHDGSGNHLCVDLDPAEGGVAGQVIRVWHDDALRERVATSYAAWLASVAEECGDPPGQGE
ncbi:molybdenum cofactor biosynthesis protein MoaA [Burkholderia stabilis]|uniref:SMI1/KNR4 family protein n=1 Tax=Burkholderia stabilis TaxID=95485 RepID=UPI0008516D5B|nr:SMI1/KNR4 family protein [Burkholderia stabilis]AOR72966.1 molybdenum cofactor biosynthesis protein MoaA [Burkholderia stabilis]HDR9490124.1 SMI1/KNR4 family protein [Burkholderia stabilis]HDR9521678.1 SMI1/KNR4 family protein [Burkholderia stabilis]HDR9537229.1 SMI1/KNR4 family protein [Burkholderia stabilis]HDR9575175.1 SMI1/KNR4 family protein [Burkholderia stabilis]